MRGELTGIMIHLRTFRLVAHLAMALVIVAILLPRMKPSRRDGVVTTWSRRLLDILNIYVRLHGEIPPSSVRSVIFVANHISWLDILAINAICRVRFVAKSEVRGWPIVGWIAARTGTWFIRRGHRRDLVKINQTVGNALRKGNRVAIFPEGTTTDGTMLKPFHAGLLEAAIESDALLWPVAIRYTNADGSRNQAVAFVGEQSLVGSIMQVLKQSRLYVELSFGRSISASGHTRRSLATRTEAVIADLLSVPSPAHTSHLQLIPVSRSQESPDAAA